VPGWVSHVEYLWENAPFASSLRRLVSFSRLILFDTRGTGLSDRVPDGDLPTLEQRVDDLRAVMDAVGSARAFIFGVSEGGPMALLFAATHPDRVAGLVTYASYPRRAWAPDYPCGLTPEEQHAFVDDLEENWGGDSRDVALRDPSLRTDERTQAWMATCMRQKATAEAARLLCLSTVSGQPSGASMARRASTSGSLS
jgi:pimeloyl-ACP methyl ester carboxylesterase